jgi:hypothetical protein
VENNLLRYVKFSPGAHTCARCRARHAATTMSFFDQQMICQDCLEDETFAPNYAAARAAERQAVRSGDQRFPGIGLADEDRVVLAARLGARHVGTARDDVDSRPIPASRPRPARRDRDRFGREKRAEP